MSISPILRIAIAASLALAAACERAPKVVAPLEQWSLDSIPRRSVGDSDESVSATFVRITDARVLPSGVLAVADGGASTVQFFDAAGARLAQLGRKGRGPGEFSGAITLAAHDSTSVAIWDPSLMRWSVAGPSSTAATSSATDASVGDAAWVHAGILVRSEQGFVPDWAPALLKTLADSGSKARVAFVDDSGWLWVHRDTGRREWVAYVGDETSGASAIGFIAVPAGLRVLQFTRMTVVGVRTDSSGFESVLELPFARPAREAERAAAAVVPTLDSAARADLMVAMRGAVVAQEVHYSQYASYTTAADSLSLEMPAASRLAIISTDARGWSGVGIQAATGFSCGMFVGVSPPRGWGEGSTRCGW